MNQKCFIFDLDRCTGCQACQLACAIENQRPTSLSWRQVYTFNPYRVPVLPVFHLSLACNHCADPPCLKSCPTHAYSKDSRTGAVTIDPKRCIGCHYCSWVCPFDVPRFNETDGVMEKCTFCSHRLELGLDPACVALCPTTALQFGDCSDPDGVLEITGFPQTKAQPAIQFIPKSKKSPPNAAGLSDDFKIAEFYAQIPPLNRSKIELRSGWPLVLFTLCAAFLVGMVAGAYTSAWVLNPILFLIIAGMCLIISTLHLTHKLHAYRALTNWRHSWLSRELVFFGVFVGLASAGLVLQSDSRILADLIILAGFIALFSIDQVYRMLQTGNFHSAQVLWTGLLLWGVFAQNKYLIFGIILLKFFLYFYRKFKFFKTGSIIHKLISSFRILSGFLLPIFFIFVDLPSSFFNLVAWLLAGELIDRFEFYHELETSSPGKQMTIEFENQLKKFAKID